MGEDTTAMGEPKQAKKNGKRAIHVPEGTELMIPDKTPEGMIALAINQGADPAVLNRLLDLQERYDAMQAKKAYIEAMTAFKQQAPAVLRRDAKVQFNTSKGRTEYTHATLGSIVLEITVALSAHGLSVGWETAQAQNAVSVTCHVTHVKGHRESVTLVGPPDDSGSKNRIQQIGSSVTYLQRYTLLAALGLATANQDDDGIATGDRPPVKMPTEKATGKKESTESNTVVGVIEKVTVKTGKTAKGEWTKIGVLVDGEWYGTFDAKLGKVATKLENCEVELTWEQDGKYKTVTSIVAKEPEESQDDSGQDDLPLGDE